MHRLTNAIVIDDKPDELSSLCSALTGIGVSSFPILYDSDTLTENEFSQFEEISPRLIFTDLQIQEGARSPVGRIDIAPISSLLHKICNKLKGPYIIIAWTSKQEVFEELKERMNKLFEDTAINPPISFDCMAKNDCKTSGEFDKSKIINLYEKILKGDDKKIIKAISQWEKNVLVASVSASNGLFEVAKNAEVSVEEVMYALAEKTSGEKNYKKVPIYSVIEPLSLIIKDSIEKYNLDKLTGKSWKEIFTLGKANSLTTDNKKRSKYKAKLNTILNFDLNLTDYDLPGDIWEICDWNVIAGLFSINSTEAWIYDKFKSHFIKYVDKTNSISINEKKDITLSGLNNKLNIKIQQAKQNLGQAKRDEIDIEIDNLNREIEEHRKVREEIIKSEILPIIINITPLCDYARGKRLYIPLVAGVLIGEILDNYGVERLTANYLKSTKIVINDKAYNLTTSSHFTFSIYFSTYMKMVKKLKAINKIARMRENMLHSFSKTIAEHNSRIATISFD